MNLRHHGHGWTPSQRGWCSFDFEEVGSRRCFFFLSIKKKLILLFTEHIPKEISLI